MAGQDLVTRPKTSNRFSKAELSAWLMGYSDGDSEAFTKFFHATKGVIFAFLRTRLKKKEDAEEALQETYLRVHRFVRSFRPDGNPLAWLFQIALNSANDLLRKKQDAGGNFATLDDAANVSSSSIDQSTQMQLREEIKSIWQDLDEEERILLDARFISDQSFTEISARLGTTEATTRQKFSRLIRRLRDPLVK